MTDEEFEAREGVKVPRTSEEVQLLTERITEMMRLLDPEGRAAFVDTLTPLQRQMLDVVEMPSLDDADALNAWLEA